jgi:hypothetical protein
MGKQDKQQSDEREKKPRLTSKTIRIRIMAGNLSYLEKTLRLYNDNSERVVPAIRIDDLINEALNRYLSNIGIAASGAETGGEGPLNVHEDPDTDGGKVKKAKGKSKKEKKSEKLNLEVAPANWTRLKRLVSLFNENEHRTGPKLKYDEAINTAVKCFIDERLDTKPDAGN